MTGGPAGRGTLLFKPENKCGPLLRRRWPPSPENNLFAPVQVCNICKVSRFRSPNPPACSVASVQVCKFCRFLCKPRSWLLGEDPMLCPRIFCIRVLETFCINLDRKSGAIRAYPAKDSCWQAAGVTDDDTVAQYLELPNHLPGDLMFIACRCQGMT